MPCPHFSIKISTRSKGGSVIAQAAYQSGERLFDERSEETKNYTKKRGIVYTEILLPPNAPEEYLDRNTLWNAVDKSEKNWNAQMARRMEIALPVELPMEKDVELIREYCQKQFVSKGMIADIAIHDPSPPGHNPHAHIMLTMRAIDEKGNWLPKSRREYELDESGNRIKDSKEAGNSVKSLRLTGITVRMPSYGDRPGRTFRTDIWKKQTGRREFI